ncbi:NAD(P)/FAD-dependent oxidoreductase [Amycolatopsis thermophila]|uniref:NADPH-dependent 2,4-dienoyl-CoA reductase/sulfur reductase-like enzyme n=1 Tax=Amycolatopsis thermophila TaxID=206084 RepID=A0ABU0EV44_9PSEU|nr:FAD-dependent oxidoreductase [Amycolatopsis thermophila]MDQ0379186.1 NADPH-dependent 2,4-dienoyl-CoA reductase/sulfur reductase-like enzyme [Amycolatopsis thermophila]
MIANGERRVVVVEHVVVVGAGLGGVRTVEQLRNQGYRGRISLVGAEPHAPYDRPPLSKQILTGAWAPERIVLKDAEALAGLAVDTHFGVPAVGLTAGAVELADGRSLAADAIVVATGAEARRLPGQPDGVHTLRTLDDALALKAALEEAPSLLVVGAGFIGAEVASAARDRGLAVTVLEAGPVPCERALGPEVGVLCGRMLTEAGVDLRLGTTMAGFADARTVRLAGGTRLSADVVLVGVGAVPRVDWLRTELDLDVTNGLACDASGRVLGADGVWAVGDVAAWDDAGHGGRFRYEHWTSVTDQAAVVARDILGVEAPAPAVPYFWSDQFGLKIQMAGRPQVADSVVPLQGEGLAGGPVKGTVAGYFAGDRFVAVAGFGAAKQVARHRMLLVRGAEKSEVLAG